MKLARRKEKNSIQKYGFLNDQALVWIGENDFLKKLCGQNYLVTILAK